MGKLQEFLMDAEIGTTQTEVQIAPVPLPLRDPFHYGSGEQGPLERPVRRSSSTRRPARSESTPTLTFTTPALWRPVAIDPNFKDADFQAKKGVRGAEDLINLVLNPGQYTDLLLAVQEINGFTDDVNELRDEAKN